MDVPTPEMGAATPDGTQLPKGSRQQLQDSTQQAQQIDAQVQQATTADVQPQQTQQAPQEQGQEDMSPPAGVDLNHPSNVGISPPSGDRSYLFEPMAPHETAYTRSNPPLNKQLPVETINALPALREAAAQPGAPQALKNMLQLLAYHMGLDGNGGGS